MVMAVIGIGSNSVRMLLAEAAEGKLRRIRRNRAGTRLFAGLDERHNLSAQAMLTTIASVEKMASDARACGVQAIHLFATSAVRDAANQAEFSQLLLERTGLTLEICSGEEEAALSFLGASGGGDCGVIDIGGGSTEIIVGEGENVRCALSCQMGAVRLAGQYPIRDHADLGHVEAAADEILCQQLALHPALTLPPRWFGTGGTFTTLAAMVRSVHWTDRTFMHGTVLTLQQVEKTARLLANMSLEERRQLPGLQPNRADIIVHGICILLSCMRRLGIVEITVSEYGNLEGYVKSRYHVQ